MKVLNDAESGFLNNSAGPEDEKDGSSNFALFPVEKWLTTGHPPSNLNILKSTLSKLQGAVDPFCQRQLCGTPPDALHRNAGFLANCAVGTHPMPLTHFCGTLHCPGRGREGRIVHILSLVVIRWCHWNFGERGEDRVCVLPGMCGNQVPASWKIGALQQFTGFNFLCDFMC